MSLTFALTGMDPTTEAALRAAFDEANNRLGGRWRLVPEAEADHVVVDMDSMYGPMSWLKLHASGKSVIGMTAAPRTQADALLPRPFTAESLTTVLQSLAATGGQSSATSTTAGDVATSTQSQVADQATDLAPVGDAMPPSTEVEAPDPPQPVEPPPPPRDPVFADWLAPGALSGRRRFKRDGESDLLLDLDRRNYHGPAGLKPLAACFEGKVIADDFVPVSDADWTSETASLGSPQPLGRLVWFGSLLAGQGKLLPGLDASGQYHLLKWPQTEREFPKHFRIATTMMKGPATVAEIAQASGVAEAEVADFINANLTTGFAELYVEPVIEPVEPKSGGLFGRLRGK